MSNLVVYAPFRYAKRAESYAESRVGLGDASGAAADAEQQLGALEMLIDSTQGNVNVDQQLVGNAQAAMLALSGDLQYLRASSSGSPTPSRFDSGSFLAGLGLALVASAVLYLALESPARKPRRRFA